MGPYSHFTVEELTQQRDKLSAARLQRLTDPSSISHNGRAVAYAQNLADIRREIDAINAELARRNGSAARAPIYLV